MVVGARVAGRKRRLRASQRARAHRLDFEAGAARNRAVGVFAALEGLGQRARTAARWRARPGRLLALGFFVNVPIAALVAALAPRYIPWPRRIALPGAATATNAIGFT
jgi:hypothetical protein